jgi:hypothetical protein
MIILNEEVLSRFINNCPKCEAKLKPYTPLPGLSPVISYCPSCDILRTSFLSVPVLCKNCNSKQFYNEDREKTSKIDSSITDKIGKLYDKKSLFSKKWIYRKDLEEDEINKLLEEIKELQKQRPRDICWYCGSTEFLHMKIEKFYDLEKNGKLKIGFKISDNYIPIIHNCNKSTKYLVRIAETTYKATCECGYEEFVFIPKWQQDEIKEIKSLKVEDSLDIISVEELDMVQKIPIMTFSEDEELFKKVVKAVKRRRNE